MEATQSFPQQKWKPGKRRSVGEIDWIEIKSITQMLPHCNYFSKDPAEWSWNEITFYKCSPNSCLFYFSPLFFFPWYNFISVFYKVPLKTRKYVTMHSSEAV